MDLIQYLTTNLHRFRFILPIPLPLLRKFSLSPG